MIKYCPNCGHDLSKMIDNIDFNVEATQNRSGEVTGTPERSLLDDYGVNETPEGVKVAKPKVLDNRKRLLRLARRPSPVVPLKRMDTEMDGFAYGGESLAIGEGLQQSF